jgi:hypothetical protein
MPLMTKPLLPAIFLAILALTSIVVNTKNIDIQSGRKGQVNKNEML